MIFGCFFFLFGFQCLRKTKIKTVSSFFFLLLSSIISIYVVSFWLLDSFIFGVMFKIKTEMCLFFLVMNKRKPKRRKKIERT